MLPDDIRPRLCHVTRDKSGFGFSVSCPEGTKGTFQLSVLQDGPADRAGVPPGSWLLELNGDSVKSYSHTQLTRKVGNKVTLLVASSAVEEFYRLRGLRVTAALADTSRLPFKVRELHLVKGPAGYGFLLKEDDCSSGGVGQFLWDVDAGLPAEQAGMKEGDRVLAVNGESIEGLDHEQTVDRIRAREDQVTLLVIDPAADEFYHSVGVGWAGEPWGALSPSGLSTAQHGPCTRSSCVSMPGSQHDTPRDSSLLTEAGSELLPTTVAAPCNLTADLCLYLPSYLQGFLRTLH
uniref:PDZ domain-containing protein n=1 Tax=Catharus ustulatus TaxID=91951 RepID=A0A8C3V6P2_CATUS